VKLTTGWDIFDNCQIKHIVVTIFGSKFSLYYVYIMEGLTPKEIQILKMLSEGFNATEISEGIGASYFTIQNHIRHIRLKTTAKTIGQAIAVAMREKVIE
jgi:DNA-binding CsgD family transcriptional regulator